MNLKHADNIRYSIEPVSDLVINKEEKEDEIIQKIDNILSKEGIEESWKKWYEASDENKTEKIQWLGQLDSEFYTKNMFLYIYLKRLRALHKHSGIENGNFTADNFFYLYTLIHEINFDNKLKVPHENMNDIKLITGDEIKAISDYQVAKKELEDLKKEENTNTYNLLELKLEELKKKYNEALAKEEEQNNKIIKWLQSTSGKDYITEVEIQYDKVNKKIKLLIYFYEKYRIKDYYKLQKRGQYFYKNNALLLDTLQEIKIHDKQSLENLDFDIKNLISIQKSIPELKKINKEYYDIELGFEIKKGNLDINTLHKKMELLVNNENIQFVKINNMVMFLIKKIASMTRIGDCDYREDELPRKRCYDTSGKLIMLMSTKCDNKRFKDGELDNLLKITYPNKINIEERYKQTSYGFKWDVTNYTYCKKFFRSMIFRGGAYEWKSQFVEYSILLNKYLTACSIKNDKIPFSFRCVLSNNKIYPLKISRVKKYNYIYSDNLNLVGILRVEHIHKNYNVPKYINEYKNKIYKNLKKQYKYLFIFFNKKKSVMPWFGTKKTRYIFTDLNRQQLMNGYIYPKKNITFDEFNSLVRYYNANIYIHRDKPNELLFTLMTKKQLRNIYKNTFDIMIKNNELIEVIYNIKETETIIENHSVKNIISYDFEIKNKNIEKYIKKEMTFVDFNNSESKKINGGGNNNKIIKIFNDKFITQNSSNINNILFNILHKKLKKYYKTVFFINHDILEYLKYSFLFEIYNNIQYKFFTFIFKDKRYTNILKYKTFNLLFYFNIELLHKFNLVHLKTKNVLEFSSSSIPSFIHCLLYKYPYRKFNLKQIYNNKYSYSDTFDKKLNSLSLLTNILGYTIDKDNNNYITKNFILENDNKNQDIIYNNLSIRAKGFYTGFVENVNKQLQFSMFLYTVNHLSKGGHYISYFKILQTKASADICLIGKNYFKM